MEGVDFFGDGGKDVTEADSGKVLGGGMYSTRLEMRGGQTDAISNLTQSTISTRAGRVFSFLARFEDRWSWCFFSYSATVRVLFLNGRFYFGWTGVFSFFEHFEDQPSWLLFPCN